MHEIPLLLARGFSRGAIEEFQINALPMSHEIYITPAEGQAETVRKQLEEIRARRTDLDVYVGAKNNPIYVEVKPARGSQSSKVVGRGGSMAEALTRLAIVGKIVELSHERQGRSPVWMVHVPEGTYSDVRARIQALARTRGRAISMKLPDESDQTRPGMTKFWVYDDGPRRGTA